MWCMMSVHKSSTIVWSLITKIHISWVSAKSHWNSPKCWEEMGEIDTESLQVDEYHMPYILKCDEEL